MKLALALLLLAAVVRLWIMPLRSSFWVDEMGTAFVVREGPDHPSLAVAPQVPQSIYYGLPRLSSAWLGFSEFAYRLPSLLAMLAALWVIALLARRLVDPQAGWFAMFACLSLRGIDYQAADARPYGLGTLVACLCLWFLVRWLDSARWPDAVAFIAAAAILWRVHLIFWPLYLVFALYGVARIARGDTRVEWLQAAAVFSLLGAALIPVLPRALALNRQAGSHVVVALPTAWELVLALKLGLVAVCGGSAWLLARIFRWRAAKPVERSSLVLIAAWWLAEPLALFAFSWLTGNSVFVPRYLWLGLPGTVLMATWAAARFIGASGWKPLAVALGAGVLLVNGQWSQPWPWHHNSDWRGAAQAIERMHLAPDTPVVCPSPFIEAKPPVWSPDYRLPGFLYAHLAVYPVPGKLYLFPFEDSPPAEEFAARLAGEQPTRFVLYGGQGQVDFWTEWFAARPELQGWTAQRDRRFGDVEVVVFQRKA